jgi:hypothetical protein
VANILYDVHAELTNVAALNITKTLCGQPVRDITHITPIVTGVSGGAALISVIIRSLLAGSVFGLDDFFAIAAMVAALPMGILEFFMAADGFGKDIWTIPPHKIYRIVRVCCSNTSLYSSAD